MLSQIELFKPYHLEQGWVDSLTTLVSLNEFLWRHCRLLGPLNMKSTYSYEQVRAGYLDFIKKEEVTWFGMWERPTSAVVPLMQMGNESLTQTCSRSMPSM